MQLKAEYEKGCNICTRPFTVFRWNPGHDAKYKETVICQTCCKLQNLCQVCLLDLEYGLPVQVRETVMSTNSNDAIPKGDVNREYFAEEHDRRVGFIFYILTMPNKLNYLGVLLSEESCYRHCCHMLLFWSWSHGYCFVLFYGYAFFAREFFFDCITV